MSPVSSHRPNHFKAFFSVFSSFFQDTRFRLQPSTFVKLLKRLVWNIHPKSTLSRRHGRFPSVPSSSACRPAVRFFSTRHTTVQLQLKLVASGEEAYNACSSSRPHALFIQQSSVVRRSLVSLFPGFFLSVFHRSQLR